MATVTVVPLLGFVGSYRKNKGLIKYAKCSGDEAERVNLQTRVTRVSTAVRWHLQICLQALPVAGGATSDPSLGYRGQWRGISVLAPFSRAGKERTGVNAATGGFGWGRRICSCSPSHGWGHFVLGRTVWMGMQPWDTLGNLILKGNVYLEDLHWSLAPNLTPAVSAVLRSVWCWIMVFRRVSWLWGHPQASVTLISLTWDHPAQGPISALASIRPCSSDVAAVLVSSSLWSCWARPMSWPVAVVTVRAQGRSHSFEWRQRDGPLEWRVSGCFCRP